ncbi:MAG: AAA family ATPase [Litorimonas sp.]
MTDFAPHSSTPDVIPFNSAAAYEPIDLGQLVHDPDLIGRAEASGDLIMICEDPADVVAFSQHGIAAVATERGPWLRDDCHPLRSEGLGEQLRIYSSDRDRLHEIAGALVKSFTCTEVFYSERTDEPNLSAWYAKANNPANGNAEYDWHGEDAKRRANPFKAASGLFGKPVPARRWLVDDWIPDQEVTLLYGDGGTGKSLLSLQLAVAVASGTSWAGLSTKAGPAIFLSAEDSEDELHRRLKDAALQAGTDLAGLSHLAYASLAGQEALLATDGASLKPTPLYGLLEAEIEAKKPSVVVLDTLANLYPGNENDRAKATQFVGFLKRLAIEHDLAVVVLAHPSLSGLSTGSGMSGSTGWNNSVRSRLYMSRIKDGEHEPDVDARTLSKKKNNYGRVGDEIAMRWDQGVFVPITAKSSADSNVSAQAAFLRLLRLYRDQGRTVSPNPGVSYAPTQFAAHPSSDGMTKGALKRAMETLLSSGKVIITSHGPASKRRSRLEIAGEDHD